MYIAGMEIANGFSELNDPAEQFERFNDQAKQRESGDDEAMQMRGLRARSRLRNAARRGHRHRH